MPAGHGDRLSTGDAALLEMESATCHLHVGAVLLFGASDAASLTFRHFVELVRSRIHRLPRYRQRVHGGPLPLSAPRWVDDTRFDLDHHVRHAALPSPGDRDQLAEYCGRVVSRPLDRDRPLWELHFIEDLAGGGVAVLSKSHSALVDGLTGLDIATVLLDRDPDHGEDLAEPVPWEPEPAAAVTERTWAAAAELVSDPVALVRAVRRTVGSPGAAVRRAADVGRGVLSIVGADVGRSGPRTVFNQPCGAHRRLVLADLDLAEVRRVKDAYGTTVNDVVLALVADAAGRFLRYRDVDTDGLELRVLVPLSVESGEEHALGSRIVSSRVTLPVSEMDPTERLEACRRAMERVSERHRAVSAESLVGLTREWPQAPARSRADAPDGAAGAVRRHAALTTFAPPTLHARASRAAARSRMFSLLVTNVPGPREPVYCLGAELRGAYPFTPLTRQQSCAVGLVSVGERLHVGITADRDALPDADRIPAMLRAALEDLARSAGAQTTRHELAGRDLADVRAADEPPDLPGAGEPSG